jgi:hypothetical protein
MSRTFKDISEGNTKGVFFALTALGCLWPSMSMADSYRHHQNAYDSEYPSEVLVPVGRVVAGGCVPANGAQVLGGYAAPGDLLDPVTGAMCNLRRSFLPE